MRPWEDHTGTSVNADSQRNRSHERRTFLAAGLLGLAGGLLSLATAAGDAKPNTPSSPAMKIKGLNPHDAPAADVGNTPGILAEGPREYNADMETQFRLLASAATRRAHFSAGG
jgi:hypothetical protein